MITLLIATHNAHKVEEIRAILGSGFRYQTLRDFSDAPNVTEDAKTFAGNATKKAVELAHWIAQVHAGSSPGNKIQATRPGSTQDFPASDSGFFVLADDSGLEVDFLKGAPGVHSARFAALDSGPFVNSWPEANNAKLLGLLNGVPPEQRTARFRCVLALVPVVSPAVECASPVCYAAETEVRTELFEGTCEGQISFAPCGHGGFGYDPLFVPVGYSRTFAELDSEEKNRLSHRAKALAKLRRHLESECP